MEPYDAEVEWCLTHGIPADEVSAVISETLRKQAAEAQLEGQMKLSDAIALGRTLQRDGNDGFSFRTCALGMGMAAVGVPFNERTVRKAIELWPWLKPADVQLIEDRCLVNLVSTHYFDVVNGHESLDQLIDFVRSIEPEQAEKLTAREWLETEGVEMWAV